jgi:hypothetical protein
VTSSPWGYADPEPVNQGKNGISRLRLILIKKYACIEVTTMMPYLPRICQSVFLSVLLVPTSLLAQSVVQGTSARPLPSPDTSIPYRTGNIHNSNYPKSHEQGMSGMIGRLPVREIQYTPGIPYVTNPYGGMFGSMGNVYSPYYRQFHQSGMSGPVTGISGIHYIVSPYAGMYGSMGNVYSPYYRQFHQSGMGGTAGALSPGTIPGQGIRYHYPYFLPPTMGNM